MDTDQHTIKSTQEPIQEPTEPIQEPTEPIQEPTEPIQEPTEPIQEPTEPTEPIKTEPVNVIYVFDNSGSMADLLPKAIRNFNTEILADQQKLYSNATDIHGVVPQNKLCLVTLIRFSGCGQIKTIFQDVPIHEIQPIAQDAMCADGMTALRTMIVKVDKMLPTLECPDRKTMIVVFTDGEDTDSHREDSIGRIKEIFAKYEKTKEGDPKHCRSLTLIGSNQDAVLTGGSMGLHPSSALTFCDDNIGDAMSSVGRMLSRVATGNDRTPTVDDFDRVRSCPSSQQTPSSQQPPYGDYDYVQGSDLA
jgi:hypothetical protein